MDDVNVILKYFKDLNEQQIENFEKIGEEYERINKNINLISRKDIDFLYEHHILHSLAIAKIFKFTNNDKIVDVGTGGGFPGIPLAIYFQDTKFLLVDSIKKKINAVNAIVNELKLKNVKAVCCRAEEINEKFDYVVGRAVKNINEFVMITKKLLKNRGSKIIYLNGINDNVYSENKRYKISDFFCEDYFINKQILEI